jgi:hypothetical protein
MYWALALLLVAPAHAVSIYSIGNSLTADSQPNGVAALAQQVGPAPTIGYHIRTSRSLDYILANPGDADALSPQGVYTQALANGAWDYLLLQPYWGPQSTQQTDVKAFQTFSAMAPGARVYLYAAWPNVIGVDFATGWNGPSPDLPTTTTYQTAQYFDNLYNALSVQGLQVGLIPVGYVLERIDQEARAGHIPGYSSADDFYRDDYHLAWDVGRYVAGATVFSTLFGQSAEGIDVPLAYYSYSGASALDGNDALRDQLAGIVWDVVSGDVRTGVVTAVPIPGAGLLLLSGLAMALRRRRRPTVKSLT